jgi:hypothetical protein
MSNPVLMIVVIMGHAIMDVVHVIRDGKEMTAPNLIIGTTPANICRLSIYTLCVVFAWIDEAIIRLGAVISFPSRITCTTSIMAWPMMTTIIKTGFDMCCCYCYWCCFLGWSCFTFLSCESMLTFTRDCFILTSTSILTGVWFPCFQHFTLFTVCSQWTTTVVTARCIRTCSCVTDGF